MDKAKRSELRLNLGDEQLLLESVELDEALSKPFVLTLDIISELGEIDLLPHMGKEASVSVKKDGVLQRHFHGLVVAGELRDQDATGHHYRLTLAPFTYFMDQNQDYTIHEQVSAREIIERIFLKHQAKVDYRRLGKRYGLREYCVQYSESDFAFVSRLMEEEGIYYYWEHAPSGHTMVLCDGTSSHVAGKPETLTHNPQSMVVFNADLAARSSASTKSWIHSWSQKAATAAEAKVTLRDFDFKKPDSPVHASHEIKPAHALDQAEWYDYPGGFESPSEGNRTASIALEAMRAQRVIMRGDTQVASLACGTKVSIEAHPAKWMNGEFLIVRCYHSITAESYRSGKHEQEDLFNIRIEAIPAATTFRAPQETPRPVVKGLESAIVVDGEGKTDDWGRVRVRFHWDREGKNSCWVRVSQTGGLGNIIMPRIGHEVLVDFLDGNPDRPLVVGRVFNQSNMPVYKLPNDWTRAVWRSVSVGGRASAVTSRAIGGINELSFEDSGGKEEVFLHAAKDLQTHVQDMEKHEVGGDQNIRVYKSRNLDVGGNEKVDVKGSIEITAGTKIVLKVGASTITIDPASIKLESPQIRISAKATLDAQAPMTTVKGNGILTLQGGLVKIN